MSRKSKPRIKLVWPVYRGDDSSYQELLARYNRFRPMVNIMRAAEKLVNELHDTGPKKPRASKGRANGSWKAWEKR